MIALQEMNLAYYYPIVYWNTACLAVNSGSADEDQLKEQATDYGKIAAAIGGMKSRGIHIELPKINESNFSFTPDVENNRILFGLKGINKIGTDLCSDIINKRPYTSLEDFLKKVKINKDKVISLIKAGCFDNIEPGTRLDIMNRYINSICGKKKRVTLQNVQMLANYKLFPKELDFEIQVFFFNKYIKKHKKEIYYKLDQRALNFIEKHFSDLITGINGDVLMEQKDWDKKYQDIMNTVRDYLKTNQQEMLDKLNQQIFLEEWEKYAVGTYSEWEMDAVSYYDHEHELVNLDNSKYGIVSFDSLPEEPRIVNTYNKNGRVYQIYELTRIAGTVLDKNKLSNIVTLLTTDGVVHVRSYKNQFSFYDKQMSQIQPDGKKKVVEKSWFTRGNKLIVTGVRKGHTFIPKVYKNSVYKDIFTLITSIDENGTITTKTQRESGD